MFGNMMPYQLTINALMAHGKRVFSESEVVSVTSDHDYHQTTLGEIFTRSAQLAHYLKKQKIKKSERVGTLAWNDFRHMELYFGVSSYGGVCHTINPRLHPEQIEYIINDAQDQILFIDVMFIGLIKSMREKLGSVKQIVVLTSDASVIANFPSDWSIYEEDIKGLAKDFSWPELNEEDACSLCYTSGTTGNPKGVLYSHRSLVLHTMSAAMPDHFGISKRDIILPVVPMFHVNAWGIPYLSAMLGCKMVFAGHKVADATVLTQLMTKEKVTISAGVPTIWHSLSEHLRKEKIKLNHLQKMIVGGTAMPPHLYRYFEEDQDVTVIHVWGMTEMSPLGTINHVLPEFVDSWEKDDIAELKLKQGHPPFGVEIKIVDDHGKELPWDGTHTGSLLVKGAWVCEHYFNKVETKSEDGWFDTGDISSIDTVGLMKISDRKKDVIKSGGEWISSIEIENSMMLHENVTLAAVIGIAHPKWDERPLLVIEKNPSEPLGYPEVTQWLTGKIAKWWLPNEIAYVDKIPLTATGKVHKLALREQFKNFSFSLD